MTTVDPIDPTPATELAAAQLHRRTLMGGGLAAGLAAFLGGPAISHARTRPSPTGLAPESHANGKDKDKDTDKDKGKDKDKDKDKGNNGTGSSALGFRAVDPSSSDDVVIPAGYVVQVLIPWGDPIVPSGPSFKADGTNTSAEQAQQFGMGHDGMHFFRRSDTRGVLVVNHEAVDYTVMFDAPVTWTREEVLASQNAHGVAVCELEWTGVSWVVVDSPLARRITANTPMVLAGPAAGHPLLQTAADPTGTQVLGTFNNCANGATPWGTYLTCEENFNGYFGTDGAAFAPTDLMKRYGVAGRNTGNAWYKSDKRFDLIDNPNEPNRFGWVVEIDPMDPASTPIKRTALGRLKHENAAFTEAPDGRAVVYTGDDQRFERLYKYVSARPWKTMRKHGVSPLDDGTLYAARFDADGTGVWLPLTPASVPGDLASILIDTRGAAAAAGATPMDRPEWVAVHPTLSGVAYGTFTNNSDRVETDAANPRPANRNGHILRWQNTGGDHAATTFVWSVFALAGTGLGTGDGSTIAPVDAFGSPDGLAFDGDGRLWIQTDGGQPDVKVNGTAVKQNNQMFVADPVTGDLRRFLVGPKGCEITGWTTTDDARHLFVNIQHPGENAPAGDPDAESNWPDRGARPRSATVAIRRADGGVIGT